MQHPGHTDATEPDRRGRRTLWAALIAGVVVMGLAALFPSIETAPDVATSFTFAPLAATPTLAERVPGWTDTLVMAVGQPGSGELTSVTWRAAAAAATAAADVAGSGVAFDASGGWMAVMADAAAQSPLRAGPIDGPLTVVADEVSGFAWHDVVPGRLAWSAPGFGTAILDVASGDTMVVETGPGAVVSWGPSGLVLKLPTGESRVVDPSGVERIVDGSYLGPHPGGLAFVRHDPEPGRSPVLVVTPGAAATAGVDGFGEGGRAVRLVPNPVDAGVAALAVGATDPAGSEITVVRIVDRTGASVASVGPAAVEATMAWTPDGRWLVAVGGSASEPTLWFFDVAAGAGMALSVRDAVADLQAPDGPLEIVALAVLADD